MFRVIVCIAASLTEGIESPKRVIRRQGALVRLEASVSSWPGSAAAVDRGSGLVAEQAHVPTAGDVEPWPGQQLVEDEHGVAGGGRDLALTTRKPSTRHPASPAPLEVPVAESSRTARDAGGNVRWPSMFDKTTNSQKASKGSMSVPLSEHGTTRNEDEHGNKAVVVAEGETGTSKATDSSVDQRDYPTHADLSKMTTMVLFDYNYKNLLDCWGKYYMERSSVKRLDLVALDPEAQAFAKAWRDKQASSLREAISVDTCLPAKGDMAERWQPTQSTTGAPSVAKTPQKPLAPDSQANRQTKRKPAVPVAARAHAAGKTQPHKKENKLLEETEDVESDMAMPGPWYDRCFWKHLLSRLERGLTVLHSDLDAFFVGDPWPYLNAQELLKTDVLAHSDQWPPKATNWGFALNTGFMMFRNTLSMINLVRELHVETFNVSMPNHTQFLFSHRLSSFDCKFNRTLVTTAPKNYSMMVGQCHTFRVGVDPLKQCRGHSCGTAKTCANAGYIVVHGRGNTIDSMCNGFVSLPTQSKPKKWSQAFRSPFG
eukprot:TRINITY_DN21855_c0_g1_i1.p1 TRINITY_DN21855_c0_g1~~TRINITY_DN21855_c0_g1_i1.p1  ORF type:complete len:542 (+),score=96.01 TRINITY_DN21855_c0_g1_i1:225-1850(+)